MANQKGPSFFGWERLLALWAPIRMSLWIPSTVCRTKAPNYSVEPRNLSRGPYLRRGLLGIL